MGRILFVTGTGTDVGKTALSLALLLLARKRGLKAAYYKPVQCGTFAFGDPPREGGDADWIRALSGGMAGASPEASHAGAQGNPPAEAAEAAFWVTYKLRMPASPHLAAEREGVAIDPLLLRREAEARAAGCDLLVLEGAGGAAVPLDRAGTTLAHLAQDLGAPALIAAAPGLGTLHHTLATAAWLRQIGAAPAGFAFCRRAPEATPLEEDNRRTLADLLGIPCWGSLPYAPALARGSALTSPEADAFAAPLAHALDAWLPGTGSF